MSRLEEAMAEVLGMIEEAERRMEQVPDDTPEGQRERWAIFMTALDYQRRERRLSREWPE